MSFDISKYKLKHIVQVKDGLLEYSNLDVLVEGFSYRFRIEDVRSEVLELVAYFKYGEVKLALGPLEKELKNFTYGKSKNQMSEHEVYEIRFSTFNLSVEGVPHEFEITGVGDTALKVSLFLKYDLIEKERTSLDADLKNLILEKYEEEILNNERHQEKVMELDKKYSAKQERQAKIREEIEREEAEKERKRRELEEMLNRNKDKNERPFKMY